MSTSSSPAGSADLTTDQGSSSPWQNTSHSYADSDATNEPLLPSHEGGDPFATGGRLLNISTPEQDPESSNALRSLSFDDIFDYEQYSTESQVGHRGSTKQHSVAVGKSKEARPETQEGLDVESESGQVLLGASQQRGALISHIFSEGEIQTHNENASANWDEDDPTRRGYWDLFPPAFTPTAASDTIAPENISIESPTPALVPYQGPGLANTEPISAQPSTSVHGGTGTGSAAGAAGGLPSSITISTKRGHSNRKHGLDVDDPHICIVNGCGTPYVTASGLKYHLVKKHGVHIGQ